MSDAAVVTPERALWHSRDMRRLFGLTTLAFAGFYLLLASVPAWAVAGGVAADRAGLVTTVMLAATVAVQAAVPAAVRRWGLGRTLAAGLVALGAPAPAYAVGHQLGVLLGVAAARGAGFAVVTVVGSILAAAVAPAHRRGESIGLYGLATALPNLVGVPAGVLVTQHGHFPVVALLGALPVLGVPLAVGLGRSAAGRTSATTSGSDDAAPVTSGPNRRVLLLVAAPSAVLLSTTLAGGGLITYLPIQLPAGLVASASLLLFGVTAALGRWRVGILADRVGTTWLLPAALLAAVLGMVAVAAGLEAAPRAVVLLGSALFGLGYGATQNLTLVRAFAAAGPAKATAASAAWNTAFDAGTGIGAILVGGLAGAGAGVPGALALTAVLMVAAGPLTVARRRRR